MSATGQTRRFVLENSGRRTKQPEIDRRSARTRTALLRALHGLTEDKDYSAITVGEIAAAANVGRSTFYAHFTSKDDLLGSGISRLSAHIRDWQQREGVDGTADPLAFSTFMFQFVKPQYPLFRSMTRGTVGKIVFARLTGMLCDMFRANLRKAWAGGSADPAEREVLVRHVIGAFMSIFTWWVERGAREPAEVMDATFRRLTLDGMSSLGFKAAATK